MAPIEPIDKLIASQLAKQMDHPREFTDIDTFVDDKPIGKHRVRWHRKSVEIDGVPLDGDYEVRITCLVDGDYPGFRWDRETGKMIHHHGSPTVARITRIMVEGEHP